MKKLVLFIMCLGLILNTCSCGSRYESEGENTNSVEESVKMDYPKQLSSAYGVLEGFKFYDDGTCVSFDISNIRFHGSVRSLDPVYKKGTYTISDDGIIIISIDGNTLTGFYALYGNFIVIENEIYDLMDYCYYDPENSNEDETYQKFCIDMETIDLPVWSERDPWYSLLENCPSLIEHKLFVDSDDVLYLDMLDETVSYDELVKLFSDRKYSAKIAESGSISSDLSTGNTKKLYQAFGLRGYDIYIFPDSSLQYISRYTLTLDYQPGDTANDVIISLMKYCDARGYLYRHSSNDFQIFDSGYFYTFLFTDENVRLSGYVSHESVQKYIDLLQSLKK